MLKAAVIGVGSMGKNHARIYNAMPDVELVAVTDLHEETAQQVGRLYGVPTYTDFEQMLDAHKPDFVSVTVPTVEHFNTVMKSIDRKIHVLVEKPIAATVDQGRQMAAHAEKNGVFLTVGHIERFNPAVIELKKRLDAGEIGKVFRAQARRMGPFPARIRDVGVIIDLATHDIDILRYVLSADIERAYAEVAQGINTQNEDLMDCVLSCSNGVMATLNINWLTPTKVRELTITGTRGMFLVNYLTQELYFYENDSAPSQWDSLKVLTGVSEGNMVRIKIGQQEPLFAELHHFVQCIKNGQRPLVSGEDGLKALAVAKALVHSGKEHVVIRFNEGYPQAESLPLKG